MLHEAQAVDSKWVQQILARRQKLDMRIDPCRAPAKRSSIHAEQHSIGTQHKA